MTAKFNLEFKLTPEESIGCFDLTNKTSVPCKQKTKRPMQVDFDESTGKLTFNSPFYSIENPTSPGFNQIKMTELVNYSYIIELYPRSYKSLLKTLTGKIFIMQDNIEIYQGSLNLSAERPPIS